MERSIIRINITFRVVKPVVIPPFSAKVSKLILHRLSRLYAKLSSSDKAFKPVAVSPIYAGDKPLLKLKDSSSMLFLSNERHYHFSCSMISSNESTIDDLISLESNVIDNVFGSQVILEEMRVEVRKMSSLGLGRPKGVKLTFLSPVLLSMPRFGNIRREKERYLLFPIPSLIIGSLIEHWNANCDSNLFIKRPSFLSIYSNYLLMEADYDIRPLTVIYDEQRRPRGFVGWVFYDLRHSRDNLSFKRIMTLLDYARYVGIGKSRATGFGQVNVNCVY